MRKNVLDNFTVIAAAAPKLWAKSAKLGNRHEDRFLNVLQWLNDHFETVFFRSNF